MDHTREPRDPPRWAAALNGLAERAIRPVPGGRVPLRAAIDAHKALTGPFVLALMAMYHTYTAAAWVYLALHGSYGVAWVLKDLTFPDRRWHRRVSLLGATGALLFLSLYWVAPAVLVLGSAGMVDPGGWRPAGPEQRAAAIFLYGLGLVLMIGADLQKNLTLARWGGGDGSAVGGAGDRGRSDGAAGPSSSAKAGSAPAPGPGLITTGFFRHVRHPNYLGEMLIYGAFALVVDHWLPWVILAAIWVLYFLPNMLVMEARLSRYAEFDEWRARTGLLLPRLGR